MGAKKNGMTILKGSLKSHWIRYVTECHLNINPCEMKALSFGNDMVNKMTKLDSKFIQPGFIFKHNVMKTGFRYHDPSIMYLKFVNGQEKNFNMVMTSWHLMKFQIE